jgi:hypothetical protein
MVVEDEREHDTHSSSQDIASEVLLAFRETFEYLRCIIFFAKGGDYMLAPYFASNIPAKVHTYARALPFILWAKPHYRSGTFQHDLVKNLRNVAFPGTGIALSHMCHSRLSAWLVVLAGVPAYALAAAFLQTWNKGLFGLGSVFKQYRQILLDPKDWFSFWR